MLPTELRPLHSRAAPVPAIENECPTSRRPRSGTVAAPPPPGRARWVSSGLGWPAWELSPPSASGCEQAQQAGYRRTPLWPCSGRTLPSSLGQSPNLRYASLRLPPLPTEVKVPDWQRQRGSAGVAAARARTGDFAARIAPPTSSGARAAIVAFAAAFAASGAEAAVADAAEVPPPPASSQGAAQVQEGAAQMIRGSPHSGRKLREHPRQ
mmetsp:Transcript_9818/g.21960  ORF Transcript_9818/g.21960 Transcript_9818/m.21960 type:complete len:210 (-) Transcript_9818:327-956(-)